MVSDEIFNIFNNRAKSITGHDPWRYGEELSLLTDKVEFEWIKNNIEINEDHVIVDVGCGTGRHVQMLSKNTDAKEIIGCDFVETNIDFLMKNIEEEELENVKAVVCRGTDFSKYVDIEKCNLIIAIGLIQYLVSEEELQKFVNCCNNLLESGGSLLLKHPLSVVGTYSKDYVRKEMETRYISEYHDLNKIMKPFLGKFELMTIERVFTKENVGLHIVDVETDFRARQMWLHLIKI